MTFVKREDGLVLEELVQCPNVTVPQAELQLVRTRWLHCIAYASGVKRTN